MNALVEDQMNGMTSLTEEAPDFYRCHMSLIICDSLACNGVFTALHSVIHTYHNAWDLHNITYWIDSTSLLEDHSVASGLASMSHGVGIFTTSEISSDSGSNFNFKQLHLCDKKSLFTKLKVHICVPNTRGAVTTV